MNYYLGKPRQNKKKRILILLLALFLSVSVSYMVFSRFQAQKETFQPAQETMKSESEPLDRPVIGLVTPLSGPFKREGEFFRQGAELAWKELQSQGVHGDLTVLDSGKEDAETIRSVEEFLSNPKSAVLMTHLPMTVLSKIIPDCERRGIILVAPAGSHENLVDKPRVVSFIPSDSSEGRYAALVAGDLSDGKKTAILFDPSPYGEILLQGFRKGANSKMLDFQEIPCKTDDPSLQKTIAEKLHPETSLVVLAGSPLWGTVVADILAEQDYKGRLLLPQSYERMPLEDLSEHFAGRLYVLKPVVIKESGNTALENFQKAFVQAYWKRPNELALLAYDAVCWVGSPLKEGILSKEELWDRLRKGTNAGAPYQGVSGKIFFDTEGRIQRPMVVTIYRDGKFVPAPDREG
ncbi:ABC transporter substrate-binding protein [Desulforhabdus amnigena]|uniref:Leucine-binding protein domain-containing protein n=1 Tax=Desulforhabdus amnigena TaxID=40218 RepID=A0A9W6L7S9_9BACT|nr:ABC transporter substrate-binding protein [Desulforhabdus amnigena]NLJ27407.1 amino acid ABC transporter substrate-binding protein [Deltaproteobacteria bacterium]GLI34932.1 hypothetical protein DAMNIGENAA_23650 [Desulforhabdus amnigena]